MNEPLKICDGTVLGSWVDFNGHMADAYYGVVFSDAVTSFMNMIGMNAAYREKTFNTIYTLETRIVYRHECKVGQPFSVFLQLLDLDQKRVHVFCKMTDTVSNVEFAWGEQLLLHTHQDPAHGPKSSAFEALVMSTLEDIWRTHKGLAVPDWVGGRIGIRRK